MDNSGKDKFSSIFRYLPIIVGDLILMIICLTKYLTKWDMTIVFLPIMLVVWGAFNFICIFIMEATLKKDKESDTSFSRINHFFYSLALALKYLAIGCVNYVFIRAIFYRLSLGSDTSFPIEPLIFLIIYDLSCLFFLWLFRKSRDREFYNFVMITLPVIIGVVIYILRFR